MPKSGGHAAEVWQTYPRKKTRWEMVVQRPRDYEKQFIGEVKKATLASQRRLGKKRTAGQEQASALRSRSKDLKSASKTPDQSRPKRRVEKNVSNPSDEPQKRLSLARVGKKDYHVECVCQGRQRIAIQESVQGTCLPRRCPGMRRPDSTGTQRIKTVVRYTKRHRNDGRAGRHDSNVIPTRKERVFRKHAKPVRRTPGKRGGPANFL